MNASFWLRGDRPHRSSKRSPQTLTGEEGKGSPKIDHLVFSPESSCVPVPLRVFFLCSSMLNGAEILVAPTQWVIIGGHPSHDYLAPGLLGVCRPKACCCINLYTSYTRQTVNQPTRRPLFSHHLAAVSTFRINNNLDKTGVIDCNYQNANQKSLYSASAVCVYPSLLQSTLVSVGHCSTYL